MKKYVLIALLIMLVATVSASALKVAVLDFTRRDRASDYITRALMRRDLSAVIDEFDELELMNMRQSSRAMSNAGISDPAHASRDDLVKIGQELEVDILLWGEVNSISQNEFRIVANVLAMRTESIDVRRFNVGRSTDPRREALREQVFEPMVQLVNVEIDRRFNIAMQHFNSQNYDSAKDAFYNVLRIDEENIASYFYLGYIYYVDRDYEQAEEHFLSGLEYEPTNRNLLDYLHRTYVQMYRFEDAIDALKQITETEQDKEIWFKIGELYEQIEYHSDAISAFQNALEIDENYADAHKALGDLLYDLERYEDSLTYLETAVENFPEDASLQRKLARAYHRAGMIDNAIAQYSRIVDEQPENITAYYNLAGAYRIAERYQEALNTLLDLEEIEPENPQVYLRLADIYIAMERYDDAENAAQEAMQLNPDLYEPYRLLTQIYQTRGYGKYEQVLEMDEMYQDKSIYYGAKADSLVAARDEARAEGHQYFQTALDYLQQAEVRANTQAQTNDINTTRNLLNQLLHATRPGAF